MRGRPRKTNIDLLERIDDKTSDNSQIQNQAPTFLIKNKRTLINAACKIATDALNDAINIDSAGLKISLLSQLNYIFSEKK